MAHLSSFRKGWENERLASFLLSRVSFVSQPMSSGDDVGIDFLCTIFQRFALERGQEALRPVTGFGVQIKSNEADIDAGGWTRYLCDLELPYFVGVVSQRGLSMDLYSAELLPLLAPHIETPSNLRFRLMKSRTSIGKDEWRKMCKEDPPVVPCLLACTLNASDTGENLQQMVEKLLRICRRVRSNISSKVGEEHLYEFDAEGTSLIMAGKGSERHFRKNALKRVGEAFHNFCWILQTQPDEFSAAEFSAYSALCDTLLPLYRSRPGYDALCGYVVELREDVRSKLALLQHE